LFSIRIKRNNAFELFTSKGPEFILGRATDCNIVIQSDVISRHHLKIVVTPEEVFILDLKSANGTYVDGHLITPQQPYVVTDQSEIRLGNMKESIRICDPREEQEKVDVPAPKETLNKSPAPKPQSTAVKIATALPHFSLQEVSKKAEAILENAKKKAREIIALAEQEMDQKSAKMLENAEAIIRDAKDQAEKIIINAEESTKVIIKKAKFDAETIVEKANVQSKLIVDKSQMEAELAVAEGRRRGESLVKSELLQIENEKIKLKEIWLEEEKRLRAEFNKFKDDEVAKLKQLHFEEREKVRKELDEKRTLFAKELLKKQETLRVEESDLVSRKYIIENEIETMQNKHEQLKNDYAQKSLALKIQYEEEKGKSELTLNELKKKYDAEMEIYKKSELERMQSFLKQQQGTLDENKKMQTLKANYSLKKSIAAALDQGLGEHIDKEQVSVLLERVSNNIDQTIHQIEEEKMSNNALSDNSSEKTVQNRNSKTATVFAVGLCVALLGVFMFWDIIYQSLRQSETYAKFMFDKMQIESVYVPIQTTAWRNSYRERVLYLKDYVEFKTNPLYLDKWTQHLTNIENAQSLRLSEDEMVQFLAREINLVSQLSALQKTIDARQLDLSLTKLKAAEDEATADFVKTLKSKENLQKVLDWEKQFVTEHMARLQQQRLPTGSK
jgi:pSer/pThr/pTyr-binding forkhead associated (FHA) protein